MLRWLVGVATLVAVILIATRFTQPRDFLRVVEHAEPWWLAIGFVLQAGTYVASAAVMYDLARVAREPLPLLPAIRISFAKLFIDQTLPSGGISGGALLVGALDKRGMKAPTVRATLVLTLSSYYFAYAIGLALAVAIGAGKMTRLVLVSSLVFIVVTVAIPLAAIKLSRMEKAPKVPGIERASRWLMHADDRLTAHVGLHVRTTLYQLAVIALDGATLWTMLRAVGTTAPVGGVFASFMLASLARTLSITPGGLGVFEGAGVLTLSHIGVPHAEALSATLLFRGLSYWLPLIPGFLATRGLR